MFRGLESLRVPDDVREAVTRSSTTQNEYTTLDEVIGSTDVLYVTRVQKERFEDPKEYEAIKDAFIVDRAVMSRVRVEKPLLRAGWLFTTATVVALAARARDGGPRRPSRA